MNVITLLTIIVKKNDKVGSVRRPPVQYLCILTMMVFCMLGTSSKSLLFSFI